MLFQISQLKFKSVRQTNIITIHSSNDIIFCRFYSEFQSLTKTTILIQPYDIEYFRIASLIFIQKFVKYPRHLSITYKYNLCWLYCLVYEHTIKSNTHKFRLVVLIG